MSLPENIEELAGRGNSMCEGVEAGEHAGGSANNPQWLEQGVGCAEDSGSTGNEDWLGSREDLKTALKNVVLI